MASNSSTISDEDGDYTDWIELYNPTDQAINLDGFGISDDTGDPLKWLFPNISIDAQSHLLIHASDKDRSEFNHAIINRGDTWKYKIWNTSPPSDWTGRSYDDSQWETGASGFGYADGDDNTTVASGTVSIYVRKSFFISDLSTILNAVLAIDYDDGFVAYINGTEIARSNIEGEPPAYNAFTNTDREARIYSGGQPDLFEIDNISSLLQPGTNILAIQVHNISEYSSDMTLIPWLILGLSEMPAPPVVPDIQGFRSLSLHTNFKVSSSGETVCLSDNSGNIIDQVECNEMPTDISYGRKPDGSNTLMFFNEPTPGTANTTDGFSMIAPEVNFSQTGGFYSGSVTLNLSTENMDYPIYYTTDCTEPTVNSSQFSSNLTLSKTTVVRAKCIPSNALPGKIITHTYILNKTHSLPVISLTTEPDNLWDSDSGIYVLGDSYNSALPYFGANFWQDWERPVHFELYETDGSPGFSANAGMKIFGGWSRAQPMKSVAIFARKKYGDSEINYQLFPDRNITTFESFVLRNSANDFPATMLRDGFMQSLIEGSNIDDQAYRPSIVYLNGEYWGIHNIREKLSEHYVASHHNVDKDNIDLLESFGQANEGDADEWNHLYSFIEANDLSVAENYDYVKDRIDIQNFIEYYLAQIYFDNQDWPGNNIKYWREKTDSGKWRWILYDTDFGFALYNPADQYQYNTLEFALEPNGPDWPNPPWSTLFLRKLMENDSFKNDFVTCFCDNLNTRFLPAVVAAKLDEAKQRISPEIGDHINKWGNIGSVSNWNANLNKMYTFGENRAIHCLTHLYQTLDLSSSATLSLKISPANSGTIRINTVTIDDPDWTGVYFNDHPIVIEGLPNPGYTFVNWATTTGTSETNPLEFIMNGHGEYTCNFEIKDLEADDILFTEINYKSEDDFDTKDWVEIHNKSEITVSISGWTFKDNNDDHHFTIPEDIVLNSDEYIVLAQDVEDFLAYQPNVNVIPAGFDFGLGRDGESVRLYNTDGNLMDSVTFNSVSPWPTEPNGTGATLALKDPDLDNRLAENWTFTDNHGTPGAANFSNDLSQEEISLPTRFTLKQNYPNPFNGRTRISFSLPTAGIAELYVYDLSGKVITKLINQYFNAGDYAVEFTAENPIASGLYFYQLRHSQRIIATKKMVYMK